MSRETEHEILATAPQHAGEGDEQDRGLQQPDTQVGRQLAQLARVLVHALIRVDAHRTAGIGEPEARRGSIQSRSRSCTSPSRSLNFNISTSQRCATFSTRSATGDDEEHAELVQEVVQVAP